MFPLKLTLINKREREKRKRKKGKKKNNKKIIKIAALIVVSLWTNAPDRK